VTIYIRVIDPDFAAVNRGDRHEILWQFLEPLADDDQSQVSLLLALTPEETKNSFASLEFDHPVPPILWYLFVIENKQIVIILTDR